MSCLVPSTFFTTGLLTIRARGWAQPGHRWRHCLSGFYCYFVLLEPT